MTISDDNQPSPSGHGRSWLATIGGSSGVTALVLQDHQAAWVILAGFVAWLIHNVAIVLLKDKAPGKRGNGLCLVELLERGLGCDDWAVRGAEVQPGWCIHGHEPCLYANKISPSILVERFLALNNLGVAVLFKLSGSRCPMPWARWRR